MTAPHPISPEELSAFFPDNPPVRKMSRSKLKNAGYLPPEFSSRATLAFYHEKHRSLTYLQWNGRIIPRDYDLDVIWDSANLGICQVIAYGINSSLALAVTSDKHHIVGELFRLVD